MIFPTLLHSSNTIDCWPKEKTNVEKLISACLKMLAHIFMIFIVNAILVSCVFYGPWTIKAYLSQTEIILWTLAPICLATGFYMN